MNVKTCLRWLKLIGLFIIDSGGEAPYQFLGNITVIGRISIMDLHPNLEWLLCALVRVLNLIRAFLVWMEGIEVICP